MKEGESHLEVFMSLAMLHVFMFLGMRRVPLPSPVAWRTDGVREVAPWRVLLATIFLGQNLNAVEQQSVKDMAIP